MDINLITNLILGVLLLIPVYIFVHTCYVLYTTEKYLYLFPFIIVFIISVGIFSLLYKFLWISNTGNLTMYHYILKDLTVIGFVPSILMSNYCLSKIRKKN